MKKKAAAANAAKAAATEMAAAADGIAEAKEVTEAAADMTKFRRFWKKSKERRTSRMSNRQRREFSSLKSRTRKSRWSSLEKESQMFSQNFYAILYENEEGENDKKRKAEARTESKKPIPEFTKEESQEAIGRFKRGKAGDSSGVRAEQKKCSEGTKEKIRQVFNKILLQKRTWTNQNTSHLHKATEKMQAITGRFAVHARLAPALHKVQPPDQGGFRPNHQTVDHLVVYRILEQRCREWRVPLYTSTIDFTKAFDRIKHSGSSLEHYGVEPLHTLNSCNDCTATKKV